MSHFPTHDLIPHVQCWPGTGSSHGIRMRRQSPERKYFADTGEGRQTQPSCDFQPYSSQSKSGVRGAVGSKQECEETRNLEVSAGLQNYYHYCYSASVLPPFHFDLHLSASPFCLFPQIRIPFFPSPNQLNAIPPASIYPSLESPSLSSESGLMILILC